MKKRKPISKAMIAQLDHAADKVTRVFQHLYLVTDHLYKTAYELRLTAQAVRAAQPATPTRTKGSRRARTHR